MRTKPFDTYRLSPFLSDKFIRVSEHMFDLLLRVNLIYLRSTTLVDNGSGAGSMLLPLILSRARKRIYPKYDYVRTSTIFRSRDYLLAFENALKLEVDIEDALANVPGRIERHKKVVDIWQSVYPRWKELVQKVEETGEEGSYAHPGIERFEEGT